MKARVLAAPLLPGKTDTWLSHRDILLNERGEEFRKFALANGVSKSRTWLQKMPQGDLLIVVHEGEDPDRFHNAAVSSDEPIAVFFRESIKEVHGVDLATVDTGPAPSLEMDVEHESPRARA